MTDSTRSIRRILVANRGEIARRVFRTARAMGISTVAVFSDPDQHAPFVAEADLAVALGGTTAAETYLDIDRLLAAARACGADAIHPGYGFLSESPAFARAVVDAGLAWIGPTPESIAAMALKVQAKRTAAEAGLPLVPGAELDATAGDDALLGVALGVGFPLLVKASAGGGGKGMRTVESEAGLLDAVAGARREAASAFGDPTVFLERQVRSARHVEVQVFGDAHGSVVHLFERECSVQRRHQKVIEESPAPGIDEATRTAMCEAAVALARRIGYVGAGTVEFLVDDESGDFYFLEMNTRLQVEHPVTEETTGLDLVEWQVRIARGERLPLAQEGISRSGHAIEARVYAEDPSRGYLPGTGTVHAFAIDGVRVDSGVEAGTVITSHYDPMLAKVIASAPTRADAIDRLAAALRRAVVHGPVTNRDSLVAILESGGFRAGTATTAFLDEQPGLLSPPVPDDALERHLAALGDELAGAASAVPGVPQGWRNVAGPPQAVEVESLDGSHRLSLAIGPPAPAAAGPVIASPRLRVSAYADHSRYVDDGLWSTAWRVLPRFADSGADAAARGPSTPVPGTVAHVAVAAGDAVVAGQTLVVIEAMKMEHRISADADGMVVEVLVEAGLAVDAHQVVVIIEPHADPEAGP